MNKPIKRNPPNKVIKQGEEGLVAIAEKLKAQGSAAFGDPNVRFSVSKDLQAMNEMGIPVDSEDPINYEAIAAKQMKDVMERIPTLEESMNFAEEKQKVTNVEVEKQEEVPTLSEDPVERLGQISEIFKKKYKTFPAKESLVRAKQIHKDIYLLELEDMVFIYRYLKRAELIQMEADPNFQNAPEDKKQDVIFNKCVLYPRFEIEQYALLPAGLVSTIVDTIQIKSMFLDPRQVAAATIKL